MKTSCIVFSLNSPHWPVMQLAPNFREMENYEVVLFCQLEGTLHKFFLLDLGWVNLYRRVYDVIFKSSGIKIKKETNIAMCFIRFIRIEDQSCLLSIILLRKAIASKTSF